MNNNTNKEKWIDDVLGSTKGALRAQPANGLTDRVFNRLSEKRPEPVVIINVKRWAAAAVLLIALNVGSVIYFSGKTSGQATGNGSSPLSMELQTISTYNY